MIWNSYVLNEEEIKKIHEESIRILEEVGVKVGSEKALAVLEKGGAQVDWDTQIALISRKMVESALASAPKEFTLGARNPQFDLHLPSSRPTLTMDGCGSYVLDLETGVRREAVMQDIRNIGKIFDHIEPASVLWTALMPTDDYLPAEAAAFLSSCESLLSSGKHLQDEIQRVEELPYFIEVLKTILGSEQAVIDRKIFSACYCTVAPLTHDKEMLEGTMELTKYKAPVLMYPMPACGTTGPASIFADVALANAESLSSVVIYQLTTPGTPLIYGAALGKANMRNGFFMEGAPETALCMMAMNQMGRFYQLPTIMAGCLTDSLEPGTQTAMEKMMTTLPLVGQKADVIQGLGLLESSMTLSYEQMLIDEEIFKQCLRFADGVDVCDEKALFEDIAAVGPGGHFLKRKSTRKAFRTDEFYDTKAIIGEAYGSWDAGGRQNMVTLAHKRIEEILKADPISPIDHNTEKIIREIMKDAEANLK